MPKVNSTCGWEGDIGKVRGQARRGRCPWLSRQGEMRVREVLWCYCRRAHLSPLACRAVVLVFTFIRVMEPGYLKHNSALRPEQRLTGVLASLVSQSAHLFKVGVRGQNPKPNCHVAPLPSSTFPVGRYVEHVRMGVQR